MENALDTLSPSLEQTRPRPAAAGRLTRRRKAAIIVRLMLNEGIDLPLDDLPPPLQATIADEIAAMRYVDGETLRRVVMEFVEELEHFGLAFPGGLEGAMALLGRHLSPEAAAALRAELGREGGPDPWAILAGQDAGKLAELLLAESPEVAAVALSKLPSPISAAALGKMPGPDARRIAFAISRTAGVPPAAVARIGAALAERIHEAPVSAFEAEPAKRMGEILDVAPAATREEVLEGLAEEDQELAAKVRRAVFTFADIPERLEERDVPALTRAVDQDTLITAMAAADDKARPAIEFILANLSQRMAGQLRDELAEREAPAAEAIELAMARVVAALRRMESAGEIRLKSGPA